MLADIVLFIHFLVLLMVILPVPLIVIGRIFHWRWVRRRWFRFGHLVLIGLVLLFHFTMGICPLTVWEDQLRDWQSTEEDEYWIKQLVVSILYPNFEPWIFTLLYVSFGVLVLSLWRLVPIESD